MHTCGSTQYTRTNIEACTIQAGYHTSYMYQITNTKSYIQIISLELVVLFELLNRCGVNKQQASIIMRMYSSAGPKVLDTCKSASVVKIPGMDAAAQGEYGQPLKWLLSLGGASLARTTSCVQA